MYTAFNPDFLIHIYDELQESQSAISKKEFEKVIILWGMDPTEAKGITSKIDSMNEKHFRREELCQALNYYPTELSELRNIEEIACDMPIRQRESIELIAVQALEQKHSVPDAIYEIKSKLDSVYGTCWNVFVVKGGYWGICRHQPGTQLIFSYRKQIVGVYKIPKQNSKKKRADDDTTTSSYSHA